MEIFITPKTFSFLFFVLLMLIFGQIKSFKNKEKKNTLKAKIYGTEEDFINNNRKKILEDDIESDRKYYSTLYGSLYIKYMNPYFEKNPDSYEKALSYSKVNVSNLQKSITEANLTEKITVEEVVSLKILGYVLLFVSMMLGITFSSIAFLLLGFIFVYLFGLLPTKIIKMKQIERKNQILKELPDYLDLLKAVTEAGLNIGEAIKSVSAKKRGPLAEEFQKAIKESEATGSFREAMEKMSTKNNIDALSDAVSDILISIEKGTTIYETLGRQSKNIRIIRTNKIQEEAKALTVKMLLPMIAFKFAPLFGIMIGPMLTQLINFLK